MCLFGCHCQSVLDLPCCISRLSDDNSSVGSFLSNVTAVSAAVVTPVAMADCLSRHSWWCVTVSVDGGVCCQFVCSLFVVCSLSVCL